MVRAGLQSWFEGTDFKVIAEVTRQEQLLSEARRRPIKIVVAEIRLDDGDVFETLAQVHRERSETAVLIFTAHDSTVDANRAHAAHASGFLSKTMGRTEFLAALQRVAAGELLWNDEQLRRVRTRRKSRQELGSDLLALTPRELETLRHVTDGSTNKQIAKAMNVSTETVKEHVQNVLRKLGVRDRTQAALRAVREHWFDPDEPAFGQLAHETVKTARD